MESLIEDVLTLARQCQPIDETARVDLSTICRQCWSVVAADGAELAVDDDLAFLADPDRVRQLLENLFRNAIDHGGSDVTIHVGALDDADGFYVADEGPGIPEEDRETVFESGFTTDEEGTGFGLAIGGEIAEAHGWTVAVTEAAEGGARFEFSGVETPGLRHAATGAMRGTSALAALEDRPGTGHPRFSRAEAVVAPR